MATLPPTWRSRASDDYHDDYHDDYIDYDDGFNDYDDDYNDYDNLGLVTTHTGSADVPKEKRSVIGGNIFTKIFIGILRKTCKLRCREKGTSNHQNSIPKTLFHTNYSLLKTSENRLINHHCYMSKCEFLKVLS